MRTKLTIILLIFLSGMLFAANTLSLGDNGDGTWNVNYSSDGAIGGFQFNVDAATINSAFGGAAGDAGFMVTSSTTTALGFSLSGTTNPAGNGPLVIRNVTGTPSGLSDIIMSDAVGNELDFTYLPSEGDGPGEFAFNQSTLLAGFFFVEVSLDGTPLESDDLVCAFIGDICVGVRQWDTSGGNNGVCELTAN